MTDQREIQALGAAISNRDWYGVERAYNQLRDKLSALRPTPAAGDGDMREAIARALAERFIVRGEARVTGSPYASFDEMPGSYRNDFYADADAVILALVRPSTGEAGLRIALEGWQPIETAPADQLVWIFHETLKWLGLGGLALAIKNSNYNGHKFVWTLDGRCGPIFFHDPQGWHPLPAALSTPRTEGEGE